MPALCLPQPVFGKPLRKPLSAASSFTQTTYVLRYYVNPNLIPEVVRYFTCKEFIGNPSSHLPHPLAQISSASISLTSRDT